MPEKKDTDLERIKELWPRFSWYQKKKLFIRVRYFVIRSQINKAWEDVNLAWLRLMI